MVLSKYPQLRYCKVLKGTKKPFEKDWVNKPYTWDEIKDYVSKERNYGILCGYGDLAVIDSDNVKLQEHIEKALPDTFKVKTGSGGVHNYYFIPELKNKIILTTFNGSSEIHWGEVQSKGTQVVAPGSIHPNGKEYKIINQNKIASISYETLLFALTPFMKQIQESEKNAVEEWKQGGSEIDDLRIEDIWGTIGLKKQGSEYYGEHPIHGSEGGMNFWLNPARNVWHCFRHNSGGGILSAIAVKEGIIQCQDAMPGVLRGNKAIESIKIAKSKYGLVDRTPPLLNTLKQESKKSLVLWGYKDFEVLKKDTNFIVNDVIYPKTVTMLYSPPGEFKSILCLSIGMAVALGKDWMKFGTKKVPVLYCDKENNDQIIKERLMSLFKGENYEDKDLPLFILRRNGDLLDKNFVIKLKEVIMEKGIKLIFFDTLHRFADYDENKSDDINRLYTFVFQPLIEECGVSIIFLHHTKKDGGYRGSGDFLGMVDTAYGVYREKSGQVKSPKFRIINEKCRAGEREIIYGEIDFGEDYIKVLRLNEEQEDEQKLSRLKDLTRKVRYLIKSGEILKKKDIEDRLEMEGFNFSLATLKRSLKWLVENRYLDKDEKGGYSIILQ